jgi:hypothetical protein
MDHLATGLAPIDYILRGGLPSGEVVEVHGPHSSLKSYIAMCSIASCQRQGKLAVLIDTDNTFDPRWARSLGVDVDKLVYKETTDVHESEYEAWEIADTMANSKTPGLIVLDKVSGHVAWRMRERTALQRTSVLWVNHTEAFIRAHHSNVCILMENVGTYVEQVPVFMHTRAGVPVKKVIRKSVGQSIWARVVNREGLSKKPNTTFIYSLKRGGIDDWLYLCRLGIEAGVIGWSDGRWWLTDEPEIRYPTYRFRTFISVKELKELLPMKGIDGSADSPVGRSRSPLRKKLRIPSDNPKKLSKIKMYP